MKKWDRFTTLLLVAGVVALSACARPARLWLRAPSQAGQGTVLRLTLPVR